MAKLYKPTAEELKTILENHKHWLREDCEGWENMHAYLSNADLSHADLSHADLSHAYLSHADLSHADLSHAYLSNADLSNADLSNADLSNADLSNADLSNAYLSNAYLSNAKNIDYPLACPSDGAFTAWKKAWHDAGRIAIIKLQIPEDAKRSSATGRKCRADKAVVLAIFDITGYEIDSAYSNRDHAFVYRKGETVVPDDFDDNRWNVCSHGIHFFITRQEAEEYEL